MRVLLTGASGFVGSHAAAALVSAGHDLRVLARPTSDLSGIEHLPHAVARGDLHGDGLDAACAGVEAVLHVAGLTTARSDAAFHDVNATGTRRLVHAAAGAGVQRFLYMSSLAAHGPTPDCRPAATEGAAHPITAYGASKAAGEEAARAFADRMSVQVLRPPVVYGPRDRGLLPFFQASRRGFVPQYGRGRNLVSFIHGQDLAEAAVSLLGHDAAPPAVFYAADADGPYTWRHLITALSVAVDQRVRALPVPGAVYRVIARGSETLARLRHTDPMLDRSRVREMGEPAWVCDSAALTARTGWTPRIALADGLRETVEWYRAHGWI